MSDPYHNRFIVTFDPDFADLALAEIAQAAPAMLSQRELAGGVTLVEAELSFAELAQVWRDRPPVFVRHVCPVDVAVETAGNVPDLAAIERAVLDNLATEIDPDRSLSVQTRILEEVGAKPYDVNTRLAAAVMDSSGVAVDVRNPQQVLSVVCAATPGPCVTAYIGLSDVEDNLSDWAGGMRRFAREKEQVSRSEFKLLEALEVFGIELPARGVALDLGAAPGGWTRILRKREQYVTAVDPGELHPSVKADADVRHLKLTAEEYLERRPDRYDLIVNDMRMDGRDSARLMVRYAEYLYADGQAILTLKLPERGRRPVIDHSVSILERAYVVLGMRQLFHNRSEVTLHLALRAPSAQSHTGRH